MKKKELFEQNTVLYNRLQVVTAELKKYKQLYAKNLEEITALKARVDELTAELEASTCAVPEIKIPEQATDVLDINIDEPINNDVEESNDASDKPIIIEKQLETAAEYGAKIIGKIVLEGTKINNYIAEKNSSLSADIINLILGKTELCKAKIHDICCSDFDDSKKTAMIDEVYTECIDYFISLKNQI